MPDEDDFIYTFRLHYATHSEGIMEPQLNLHLFEETPSTVAVSEFLLEPT